MAEYDVAVIGGGPAGYVGAIRASRLGAKTLLVEKDELGGTCLNRGCIPAKTLLKTAELVHEIAGASKRGIRIADPSVTVDMAAAVAEKNRVVKKLTGGVGSLLKANGVDVIKGAGVLQGRSAGGFSIRAGTETFDAKKVLLAGGSRTAELPVPGADLPGVMDSTEILDLETIPPRLAIVGGGVIGIELAMAFLSFGSAVTIIEALPRILPPMDRDISDLLHKTLTGRGAVIHTGTGLSRIEQRGNALFLTLAGGKTVEADKVLISIGRTADLSALGDLTAAPVPLALDKGKALVNDYMESSVPGIFAPGDINGKKMLAHAAFAMAECAAENAVNQLDGGGKQKKVNLDFVPSVVYSFPEAASVGLTQEGAEKTGPVSAGNFPLAVNGRALASGSPEGFVKVLADPKYGRILGVHMAGHGASEIINEAAALMAMEITVHELAELIHGHPTVSEALMEAAADALGRCVHLPPKKRK
ncbi:MAG: dihydrolipoyl dehydrogenase [Treponema sp.]|jgi:dihydrolipoamide dehydrogenase|nr:dihydrolipoyl dehydrogenase [Treponema sp.]